MVSYHSNRKVVCPGLLCLNGGHISGNGRCYELEPGTAAAFNSDGNSVNWLRFHEWSLVCVIVLLGNPNALFRRLRQENYNEYQSSQSYGTRLNK